MPTEPLLFKCAFVRRYCSRACEKDWSGFQGKFKLTCVTFPWSRSGGARVSSVLSCCDNFWQSNVTKISRVVTKAGSVSWWMLAVLIATFSFPLETHRVVSSDVCRGFDAGLFWQVNWWLSRRCDWTMKRKASPSRPSVRSKSFGSWSTAVLLTWRKLSRTNKMHWISRRTKVVFAAGCGFELAKEVMQLRLFILSVKLKI